MAFTTIALTYDLVLSSIAEVLSICLLRTLFRIRQRRMRGTWQVSNLMDLMDLRLRDEAPPMEPPLFNLYFWSIFVCRTEIYHRSVH